MGEKVMINQLIKYSSIIILIFSSSCNRAHYSVSEESTRIGKLDLKCFDSIEFKNSIEKYSIENADSIEFRTALKFIDDYFIKPNYLVYFDDYPKEIVGFDKFSVIYVFSPTICNYELMNGKSSNLSDKEKKRITERVESLICP